MAALPERMHSLAAAIYRWREETTDDGLRPHLGASLIGHPCMRYLWLTFRWAARPKWEGRMLRLFDRGQREEAVIVAELRGIGAIVMEVDHATGAQFRVSACGGHFGGAMDGIARNLPDGSPDNWELLEFKTHNAKSFKELIEKRVEVAKHQHYCQMQTYLSLTGMTRANYIAINKDTDDIYHERIHADPDVGRKMIERAEAVIFAPEPPPRISTDPAWWQCKMCHYHGLCHGTDTPLPNCRTCAHATPERDGKWTCDRNGGELIDGRQRIGCQGHRFIPILLENYAELVDANPDENWVKYRHKQTGAEIINGMPPDGLPSEEIMA